jgi:hypothetical protein
MRLLDPRIPILERGARISDVAGTKPAHDAEDAKS